MQVRVSWPIAGGTGLVEGHLAEGQDGGAAYARYTDCSRQKLSTEEVSLTAEGEVHGLRCKEGSRARSMVRTQVHEADAD